MSYQVSEFEQQHINKIKKELENYKDILTIEKAYYIYYRMCQYYIRNYSFYYGHGNNYIEEQYYKQTSQDRKATCLQENAAIAEAMRQEDIKADYLELDNLHHVDGYFMINTGEIYFFNAYADLTRSKTGRIIREFGLDFEYIKVNRVREYYEYILNYFAKKGININKASQNKITQEQIRQMNSELKINPNGIALNDFLVKLGKIVENEEYMQKKFGTKDKGKQIEGVIDIINLHKTPNDTEFKTDYSTGSENYVYLFQVFPEKYYELFDGKEIAEPADKERKIFFVKQAGKIVAYEFDVEIQKLKKINVQELAKENIINVHSYRGYEKLEGNKRTIGYAIERMQKECEVPEH